MSDRITVSCAMNIPMADFYHIKPSVSLSHELQEGEDYDTVFPNLSFQCTILFYRQAMMEAEVLQSIMTLQGQMVLADSGLDPTLRFRQRLTDDIGDDFLKLRVRSPVLHRHRFDRFG